MRKAANDYRTAGDRLLRDLRSTTHLDPMLDVWVDHESLVGSISLDDGRTALTRDLPMTVDEHEAAVGLVDRFSTEIVEALWSGWPQCPSHGHPLDARVVDGAAWWCCPTTGEAYCAFGGLAVI